MMLSGSRGGLLIRSVGSIEGMQRQFNIWRVLAAACLIAIIVFVVLAWQSGALDLRRIIPPYSIGGQPSEYTFSHFCGFLGSLGLLPLVLLPFHAALLWHWTRRPMHLYRVVASAVMPFLYLIYGAVFFLADFSALSDVYVRIDMKDTTMFVARMGEISASLWASCLASFVSLAVTIVLLSRSKPISANQAMEGTAR